MTCTSRSVASEAGCPVGGTGGAARNCSTIRSWPSSTKSPAGRAQASVEDVVVDRTFDDAVGHAIDALPEQFRTVVLLVDATGLSYLEAAELLGVPEGTVTSRLHRARKRVRDELAAADLAPRRRRL